MAEKKKIELKRVSMNLPSTLVDRVTKYGKNLGLNTTSAYIVLLNQALEQSETLAKLPAIMQLMDKAEQMYPSANKED